MAEHPTGPGPAFRPLRAGRFELLPLAVLVLIWALSVAHYPRLPESLPGAFRLGGEPAAWVPKTLGFFTLPALATLAYTVLGLVGRSARRRPRLRGRALEGAAAAAVDRLLTLYLFLAKSALLVFLLNLTFRVIQVSYGRRTTLGWDTYGAAVLLLVYVAWGSVWLYRGASRWLAWQERRQSSSGNS